MPGGRLGAIALLAIAAAGASTIPLQAEAATRARAHIANALNVTDTGHLRSVRHPGALIVEEGPVTGGLPGTVTVQMTIGATVTGSFTITTRYGSITGHASGDLKSTGTYASFGGAMTVVHGTGRYAHAHGHGGFYGTIDRNTYALTVQTTGTLYY
jgi:hypothetical protein